MSLRFWTGEGGVCQVGSGEISMAGEGGAGLAVDEEANLRDGGDVGVEGLDDGEQGESFGLDAGGLGLGKGSVEVDHGELPALLVGDGQQEDAVDASVCFDGVRRAWGAPTVEELLNEGAGA